MLSNFCNNYNGKKLKKQQQKKKKQQQAEEDGAWGITRRASRTAINMQSKCQIAGQMPNDQEEVQQGQWKGWQEKTGEGREREWILRREYLKEGCLSGSSTQTIMAMIKASIVAQTEWEKAEGEKGRECAREWGSRGSCVDKQKETATIYTFRTKQSVLKRCVQAKVESWKNK